MDKNHLAIAFETLLHLGVPYDERMIEEVVANIRSDNRQFTASTSFQGQTGEWMDVKLHIWSANPGGSYVVTDYLATLQAREDRSERKFRFRLSHGRGIELPHAFNLLSGRAVYQDLSFMELPVDKAWIQLSFQQRDPEGNFHLKIQQSASGFSVPRALLLCDFEELKDDERRTDLIRALEGGELYPVTRNTRFKKKVMLVSANPFQFSLAIRSVGSMQEVRKILPGWYFDPPKIDSRWLNIIVGDQFGSNKKGPHL